MNKKPNATSWKPGQSGNPGGRLKGIERQLREEIERCTQMMRKADGSAVEEVVEGFRAIARRLWHIAMSGEDKDSLVAIKVIYERVYGAPRQTVELAAEQPATRVDWSQPPEGVTKEEWEQRRREMLIAHEQMRQLAQPVEAADVDAVEH